MAEIRTTRLLMSEYETHDVKRFTFEMPGGLAFEPGQGIELALDHPDWRDQWRPFTPTSLPDDGALQFVIKAYPGHHGVTTRLHDLRPGDPVRLREVFGSIRYRGPGVFLAGGAGITPFIAILRELRRRGDQARQTLVFANKTADDIIFRNELEGFFGDRCHLVLSDERRQGLAQGHIDRALLQRCIDDIAQYFYLCGPPGFVEALHETLDELGLDRERRIVEAA